MNRNRLLQIYILLMTTVFAAGVIVNFTRQTAQQSDVSVAGTTEQVYYVDQKASNASDNNDGSINRPFKTANKGLTTAFNAKKGGKNVKVVVKPGVYRERINLNGANNSAELIIEGAGNGQTVFSAAEVFNFNNEGSGTYSIPWTNKWGLMTNPWASSGVNMSDMVRRREVVYVNNQLLIPVLSKGALGAGKFFVDEAASKIFFMPKSGTNMQGATVEAAVRDHTLTITQAQNFVIKGIVFEKAASMINEGGAEVTFSSRFTIEDSEFNLSNYGGLDIENSSDYTLRNVTSNDNGNRGIGVFKAKNILLENTINNRNNWRGKIGNWFEWDSGQKFLFVHNGTFRNYTAIGNFASGLWLDFNNQNILVENSYFENNELAGIFIEANDGPITVKNSKFFNNYQRTDKPTREDYFGAGIFITGSTKLLFENNVFMNNKFNQVLYTNPDRTIRNWVTNEVIEMKDHLVTMEMRNNTFVGTGKQYAVNLPNRSVMLKNVKMYNNTYYNSSTQNIFKIHWSGTTTNLAGFTSRIGVENGGVFRDPGQVQAQPTTSCGDGIVQTPNSQGVNEVCDDGNTANFDKCSSDCRNACTGNTIWNGVSCTNPYQAKIEGNSILIQAEDFNLGGQNVGFFEKVPNTNQGGAYRNDGPDIKNIGGDQHAIGWFSTGEWLKYDIAVPKQGTYRVIVRGTAIADHQLRVGVEGGLAVSGKFPIQSSYNNIVTTEIGQLQLTGTNATIRLESQKEFFDIDYIRLEYVDPSAVQQDPVVEVPSGSENEEDLSCKSDFNKDGNVDILDFAILGRNWNRVTLASCSLDIVGNDCRFDIKDFAVFSQYYGKKSSCGQ